MTEAVEREVQLHREQRALAWRQNHGHVKCKTCSFCDRRCHIDEQGQWHLGKFYDSRHVWYCSYWCAAHLNNAFLASLLAKNKVTPQRAKHFPGQST